MAVVDLDLGDCTGRSFLDYPAEFFNGKTVRGCFYQTWFVDVEVFPPDIVGVKFVQCNLDNVKLPTGAVLGEESFCRRVRIQNDKEHWIVDETGNPVTPLNAQIVEREGGNANPALIPAKNIVAARFDADAYDALRGDLGWWRELPEIISETPITQLISIDKKDWSKVKKGPFVRRRKDLEKDDSNVVIYEYDTKQLEVSGEKWLHKDKEGRFYGNN